jgi:hypothetical protein
MPAYSIPFTSANSTLLDHLLLFVPTHANESIGMVCNTKLHVGSKLSLLSLLHCLLGALLS